MGWESWDGVGGDAHNLHHSSGSHAQWVARRRLAAREQVRVEHLKWLVIAREAAADGLQRRRERAEGEAHGSVYIARPLEKVGDPIIAAVSL